MFVSMGMLIINSCAAGTPKKKSTTKYYKYYPNSWYLQYNPSELLSDQWEKHLKKQQQKKTNTHTHTHTHTKS